MARVRFVVIRRDSGCKAQARAYGEDGLATIGGPEMKWLSMISLILIIVGGINWGLVGLFEFNLVAAIFSFSPALIKIIYILVGLSAVYQLMPLSKSMQEQMA
jgi:uncharacterized membrane protein YuzA (DUF378 family)